MECSKRTNSVVVAFIVFLILAFLAPSAYTQSNKEVKVGYFYDGEYMYKTEENAYRGYDVEYLYELARFTGWKYTFVEYETFSEECAALEKGEIDIIPALYYSEERSKKYLFSFSDMGKVYNTLVVRKDNTSVSYNDYAAINKMKIGVLQGTIDTDQFIEWCHNKGLSPNIIKVATNTKLLDDLDKGVFDGVATSFMGISQKYRTVAEFSSLTMYFAVSKSRPELMDQLTDAMIELYINSPDYQSSLYKKYFSVSRSTYPVFTRQEQDFISNSNVLRIALQGDNPPYSYIDQKGKMCGAIVDLFSKISELSGLHFTYVLASSAANELEMVMSGDADIAGKCYNDSVHAANYNILLTNPYLSLTLTQITKKNVKEIKKIALTEFVKPSYPMIKGSFSDDCTVTFYTASKQCFAALNKGLVDAAVIGSAGANYYINVNRASNYSLNTLNGYGYQIAAGVNRNENSAVISIINRCIHQTDSSVINDFILKYSTADSDSFHAFINKIPVSVALVFILVLLLVIILLVLVVASFYTRNKQKEELRIAKKENQIKTDFLGTMSHDMRTPLNAVLGFTGLAQQTEDLKLKNSYLEKINQSGNLLLNLVNSALFISKYENKKLELHPETVNWSELIKEIEVTIKGMADKKGILFTVGNIGEPIGFVIVDKLNLQKIILNLLSNAVNFTNEGGNVSLVYEKLMQPVGKSTVKIMVRDTGIGMSKSFMTRMYEPFIQEKSTSATGTSGAGLGLSIVKKLVELMEGHIEVTSELGKGTEFTVYLPIQECASPVVDSSDAFQSDVPRPDNPFFGMRMLLCEDNEMNTEIAVALLESKNIIVDTAVNGKEGVSKFTNSKESTYNAVLMDLRMPVMDGYAASRSIRSLNRNDAKRIPIIALTADAFEDDKERCIIAGMNAHVSKPIDQEILFKTLAEVLAIRKIVND